MYKNFKINGKKIELRLENDSTLLKALRDNGFTEVKNGCEEGQCGACMVLIDGRPVNSCQIFAISVQGKEITTVKGIGRVGFPSFIQEAYVDAGAVQCGFCTPGFIISTYALLKKNPNPSEEEILEALDGNLCRCTGYEKILDAVRLAAKRAREGGRL
ncbi:MAG: ferredoxin [Candidatus Muiribacterium halophilum]|uniref:Ferredoxin n=1 Tax=Muiribacterium halophilum TaxID=2053465 RepID=A0A2N5ZLK9_MUIH1|nr:MAG: ferredoxin [Candidatus Muirbacterium halophilum]